jgi:hypothetical protein
MRNSYIENGLLRFDTLRKDPLSIVTTYDNDIWGNMNPYFSTTENEKLKIKEKDQKICKILDCNTTFVLTTPPENTICNLNTASYKLLTEINKENEFGNKFIPIRANALIFGKQKLRTTFVVAPADCPIITITNKQREFIIIIHLGFPQYIQNLHLDTTNLAAQYFDLESDLDIFITPYICSEHYIFREDKYIKSLEKLGSRLENYSKKVSYDAYKEIGYCLDIEKIIKEEILSRYTNATVHDTGICTYEEASKGHLFSHKYVTDQKQIGNDIAEGQFNVLITL